MNIYKSLLSVIFWALGFTLTLDAQSYELNIKAKNYLSDTIIIGNYYGEKQIVRDTLISKDKSSFIWKEDTMNTPGMYILLLKPSNSSIQFFVSGTDRKVTLEFDAKDAQNPKFKGSPENQEFYKYMDFLKDRRVQADSARARITRAKAANKTDEESNSILTKLDKDVKEEQKKLLTTFPGTVLSLMLKASTDIEIPEFTGDEKDVQLQRYKYYKNHFFDNLDFQNKALLRTPFLYSKFDQYLNKLTSPLPDSIIPTLDLLLSKVEQDKDAYRYFLADYLNKYASMKIVGHDAVYVHLVDKYYSAGKAPWLKGESLEKMVENANDLRPILIGKIIPDITTYFEDGKPINLHSIKAKYTVVVFWAPDCGHCKKIMPEVVKFYDNNKDKDVKIFSVCTKSGEKLATCWPAIQEKNMQGFINTGDEYARFNQKIRVKSTPKIFILDESKKILIKDIGGEDLEKIFGEILKEKEGEKPVK